MWCVASLLTVDGPPLMTGCKSPFFEGWDSKFQIVNGVRVFFFLFLCDGLCEVSWWVFENGIEVTFKLSSRDSDDLVEQMGVTLTVLLSAKA